LAKLFLFPNSEYEKHWKNEIATFITRGASTTLKGGEFSYSWFFEGPKPFTERRLQVILENAQDSEENLESTEVSINDFETLLILFEKELNKAFKRKRDVLLKQEIKEILTNCLREY
jgi:hypothetical protein